MVTGQRILACVAGMQTCSIVMQPNCGQSLADANSYCSLLQVSYYYSCAERLRESVLRQYELPRAARPR